MTQPQDTVAQLRAAAASLFGRGQTAAATVQDRHAAHAAAVRRLQDLRASADQLQRRRAMLEAFVASADKVSTSERATLQRLRERCATLHRRREEAAVVFGAVDALVTAANGAVARVTKGDVRAVVSAVNADSKTPSEWAEWRAVAERRAAVVQRWLAAPADPSAWRADSAEWTTGPGAEAARALEAAVVRASDVGALPADPSAALGALRAVAAAEQSPALGHIDAHVAVVATAQSEVEAAAEALRQCEAERDAAVRSDAEATAELAALDATVAELEAGARDTAAAIADETQRLADAERSVAESRAAVAEAKASLATVTATVADLQRRVEAKAAAEAEQQRREDEEVAAMAERLVALRAENAAAEKEVLVLEASADAAVAKAEREEAAAAHLRDLLAAATPDRWTDDTVAAVVTAAGLTPEALEAACAAVHAVGLEAADPERHRQLLELNAAVSGETEARVADLRRDTAHLQAIAATAEASYR